MAYNTHPIDAVGMGTRERRVWLKSIRGWSLVCIEIPISFSDK
jgi:hypothetical protein